MDKAMALRQAIAEFGFEPSELTADFPLSKARFNDSIGRAMVFSAIERRTGIKVPPLMAAKTYGELESKLLGTRNDGNVAEATTASPANPAVPAAPAAIPNAIGCGIDVEEISRLPQTDNFWEHDFYRSTFTPREIAYCLMQEEPRIHFAGRWCAKEALKKCDLLFIDEPLNRVEVAADGRGAPTLWRLVLEQPRRLPHAVSISHTREIAMAIVVSSPGAATAPTPVPKPAVETSLPVSARRRTSAGMMLIFLSFCFSVLAFLMMTRLWWAGRR